MFNLRKLLRFSYIKRTKFSVFASSPLEDTISPSAPKSIQSVDHGKRVGLPTFTMESFPDVLKAYPRLYMHSRTTWTSIAGTLFSQGFSSSEINRMFLNAPQLLDLNINDINNVLKLFRECKIGDKNMLRIMYENPELLCLNPVAVEMRLNDLYTIVSRADITKILKRGIFSIFIESWDVILEKLQYIDSEMGLDQQQMMNANAFGYSLDFIKMRHKFFRRCGKYKKPNPKVYNPKQLSLKMVLECSKENLSKFSGVTLEEYNVFQKLCEEELEIERIDLGYNSDADYNN